MTIQCSIDCHFILKWHHSFKQRNKIRFLSVIHERLYCLTDEKIVINVFFWLELFLYSRSLKTLSIHVKVERSIKVITFQSQWNGFYQLLYIFRMALKISCIFSATILSILIQRVLRISYKLEEFVECNIFINCKKREGTDIFSCWTYFKAYLLCRRKKL